MEDTGIETPTTTSSPTDDYRQNIYANLKAAYPESFTRNYDDFSNKLDSDPQYSSNIYENLKAAYPQSLTKSQSEFQDAIKGNAQKADMVDLNKKDFPEGSATGGKAGGGGTPSTKNSWLDNLKQNYEDNVTKAESTPETVKEHSINNTINDLVQQPQYQKPEVQKAFVDALPKDLQTAAQVHFDNINQHAAELKDLQQKTSPTLLPDNTTFRGIAAPQNNQKFEDFNPEDKAYKPPVQPPQDNTNPNYNEADQVKHLYRLGVINDELGNKVQAMNFYSQAHEANPNQPEPILAMSAKAAEEGDIKGSNEGYDQIINNAPPPIKDSQGKVVGMPDANNTAAAYQGKGYNAKTDGDIKDAQDNFAKAYDIKKAAIESPPQVEGSPEYIRQMNENKQLAQYGNQMSLFANWFEDRFPITAAEKYVGKSIEGIKKGLETAVPAAIDFGKNTVALMDKLLGTPSFAANSELLNQTKTQILKNMASSTAKTINGAVEVAMSTMSLTNPEFAQLNSILETISLGSQDLSATKIVPLKEIGGAMQEVPNYVMDLGHKIFGEDTEKTNEFAKLGKTAVSFGAAILAMSGMHPQQIKAIATGEIPPEEAKQTITDAINNLYKDPKALTPEEFEAKRQYNIQLLDHKNQVQGRIDDIEKQMATDPRAVNTDGVPLMDELSMLRGQQDSPMTEGQKTLLDKLKNNPDDVIKSFGLVIKTHEEQAAEAAKKAADAISNLSPESNLDESVNKTKESTLNENNDEETPKEEPIAEVPKEYTAFRYGEEGKDGVTFSSKNKDYSEEYARVKGGKPEDVKEVKFTANNPLEVELSTNEFSDPVVERKYIEQAKKDGHDLVIFKDKVNGDEFYAKIDKQDGKKELSEKERKKAEFANAKTYEFTDTESGVKYKAIVAEHEDGSRTIEILNQNLDNKFGGQLIKVSKDFKGTNEEAINKHFAIDADINEIKDVKKESSPEPIIKPVIAEGEEGDNIGGVSPSDEGKYENAISEGRMTAEDAVKIIESAGLEVPKEISDLAKKADEPIPVTSLQSEKIEPIKVAGTEVIVHGEDTATAEGVENGTAKTDLTPKGEKYADKVGQHIIDTNKKGIISSAIERAKQTAKEAAKYVKDKGKEIQVQSNKLLNTLNIGNYDGKPEGSFSERDAFDHPARKIGETGETINSFKARMEKAYQFVKDLPKDIQVIAHSKVLRAFEALEKTNGKWTTETTKYFLDSGEEKEVTKEVPKEVKKSKEPAPQKAVAPENIGEKKVSEKEQKIINANKSIDDAANWLKDKLKIDLPPGTDKLGIGSDDIIDLIGKAAKQLVKTGIEIHEAVKQVIDSLKEGKFLKDEDAEETYHAVLEKHFPEPEPKDLIGVTNADTDAARKSAGLDPLEKEARLHNQQVWDETRNDIDKGEINPKDRVAAIAAQDHPEASLYNQAIVLHDRIRIATEQDAISKAFEDARKENDQSKLGQAIYDQSRLDIDRKNNDIANTKMGTEWGRFGQFRQRLAAKDYTLSNVIRRAESANLGEDINDKLKDDLKAATDKIEQLQKDFEDWKTRRSAEDEINKRNEAEARKKWEKDTFEKLKAKAKKENELPRTEPSKRYTNKSKDIANKIREFKNKPPFELKDADGNVLDIHINGITWNELIETTAKAVEKAGEVADDIRNAIHDSLKDADWFGKLADRDKEAVLKQFYNQFGVSEKEKLPFDQLTEHAIALANGELNESMKPVIDNMVYSLVKENLNIGIDGVTDKIYDALKDHIPDLDKNELKDLISGYGKFKLLSKDAVRVAVSELKLQGRLDSGLKAVTEKNELPLRSGLERAKKTQLAREKLKDTLRMIKEKGLTPKLTDEDISNQYKSAEASYQTKLENAIADTQKEIDTGIKKDRAKGKDFTSERTLQLKADLKKLKAIRDAKLNPPKTDLQKLIDRAQKQTEDLGKAKEEGRTKDADQIAKEKAVTEGQITNLAKAANPDKIAEFDKLNKLQTELDRLLSEKTLKEKDAPKPDSDAIKALKDQIQLTKDDLGLTPSKAPPLEAQKEATQKQINEIEKAIQNIKDGKTEKGDLLQSKTTNRATDARLTELRNMRDSLKEEYNKLLPQNIKDAATLVKWKTNREVRLKFLQDKLKSNDPENFGKKPKTELPLDSDGHKINLQIAKVQKEVEAKIDAIKLKNRSNFEKIVDNVQRYHVFNLLLDPNILGKLAGHTVTEALAKSLDETFGKAVYKIFPDLAKGASLGEPSAKAIAEYYSTFFSKSVYQDAWATWKTGQNTIDTMYGIKRNHGTGWLDKPGITHNMEKTIIQTAEFRLSLFKRIQAAQLENPNLDLTDEHTRMTLEAQAAADSIDAKLMNKTILNDMINRAISGDKGWNKAAKLFINLLMPIRNVPLNVVRGTLTRIGGLPYGLGEIAYHKINGTYNEMPPALRDKIIKHIAKGSTGALLVAFGIMNPTVFGGFYQRGKRDDNDVKAGGLRVFGKDVPPWLAKIITSNPIFMAIQFGATIRRNMDNNFYKQQKDVGVMKGIMQGIGGFEEHVPMLNEGSRISDAMSSNDKARAFAVNYLEGFYLPRPVSRFAQFQDKDANGNDIKRKPQGWGQAFEQDIPGLRENVPTKSQVAAEQDIAKKEKAIEEAKNPQVKIDKSNELLKSLGDKIAEKKAAIKMADSKTGYKNDAEKNEVVSKLKNELQNFVAKQTSVPKRIKLYGLYKEYMKDNNIESIKDIPKEEYKRMGKIVYGK